MTVETVAEYGLFPVRVIAWILSLPIRLATWVINLVRVYDPEEAQCPSCGFTGDSGTGSKSCKIETIKTTGPEKAAIKHTCFRCSAEWASKTMLPADKWLLSEPKRVD